MTFLAPLLLALSGFAALPVLLHLIRRKRIRILDFPTFRFLKKAAMEQRIHLRLQDQLLMILRILILLLLAVAFAGPSSIRRLDPDALALGSPNFLIVDDSLSMAVQSEGGRLYDTALHLAQKTLKDGQGEWRVAFASDLAGDAKSSTEEIWATSREDFENLTALHPAPDYRGPMSGLLARIRGNLGLDSRLWLITDHTASNWSHTGDSNLPDLPPAEILTVGPSSSESNSALTHLVLKNDPLFPGEPALLSVGFESFGTGGAAPAGLRFVWTERGGETFSETAAIPEPGQGRIEVMLAPSSAVGSVSASLVFPPGISDRLPQDDTATLIPRIQEARSILILAEDPHWKDLLRAALAGFEVSLAGPQDTPAADSATAACYLVVLGREPISQEWADLIRVRVESGAGLLVCYDQPPDGPRLEAWSAWWSRFGVQGLERKAEPGEALFLSGANPWFSEALDPAAKKGEWASGGLQLYELEGWRPEWLLKSPSGQAFGLFQTQPFGGGLASTWNVPLSTQNTGLILTTGWVPLLSQMVKRTLIDTVPASELTSTDDRLRESDLTPLSPEEIARLIASGCHLWEATEVMDQIDGLPSSRYDWTVVILGMCLLLALAEVGLSNFL